MATKIIGLDAGHGLNTAGKQTPDGIKEWTLNDKVRDKVVKILSDYDCKIINVDNNEGKKDESLATRVRAYINAGADVFVSIHHNAYTGKWNNATGVEVYTDRGPTAGDSRLAKCIYDRLVKYTGLKGRGIKANDWYVINQDEIPAVLVEGGFMDGTSDYKVITSDAGQTAYAKAIAEGLIEFLNLSKKNITNPIITPTKKSVEEIAKEVLAGKWGNGDARKKALASAGYDYTTIQTAVNKLSKGQTTAPAKKSNAEIAKEVMAGKWGNGADRKKKLEAAGYNYAEIQKEVNKLAAPKGYKVMINTGALNVRAGAGTKYKVNKVVRKGQTFTIVEEKSGWGKLSDGSGWISLNYTKKV